MPGRRGASTRSTRSARGVGDRAFLERIFQKLLLNFTWWVNRKDSEGRNVFQGGFLGLDNIGVFDRSAAAAHRRLHRTGRRHQLDGDVLPQHAGDRDGAGQRGPGYEDVASKFWEHFLYIANAMNNLGADGAGCGTRRTASSTTSCNCRTTAHAAEGALDGRPDSAVRGGDAGAGRCATSWTASSGGMNGLSSIGTDLTHNVASMHAPGRGASAGCSRSSMRDQLRQILRVMLDEERVSVAVRHPRAVARPPRASVCPPRQRHRVLASTTSRANRPRGLFGGNSNWRGPIWFPVNFLLIESLQKFHHYFGDEFKVECPTGSGQMMTLWEVAAEISRRLTRIFLKGPDGRAPVHGAQSSLSGRPALAGPGALLRVLPRRYTARVWAPATRPAGPASSRSCSSRAANGCRVALAGHSARVRNSSRILARFRYLNFRQRQGILLTSS